MWRPPFFLWNLALSRASALGGYATLWLAAMHDGHMRAGEAKERTYIDACLVRAGPQNLHEFGKACPFVNSIFIFGKEHKKSYVYYSSDLDAHLENTIYVDPPQQHMKSQGEGQLEEACSQNSRYCY
jgi:hypothetical protein